MFRRLLLLLCLLPFLLSGCRGKETTKVDNTESSSAIRSENTVSQVIENHETTENASQNSDITTDSTVPDNSNNTSNPISVSDGINDGITNDELEAIPPYNDEPYIIIKNNIPSFTGDEKNCTEPFEIYNDLDSLGRCSVAFANVCKELMPTEKRGDIGDIKPSGWHTVKYPDVIEDNYLFNRSHLIAYSLAGENANEKNLITGTRYLNQETMQIFELQVLEYVRNTNNHVLYRVTPIFEGDNLLATGVHMEAWSVEDEGKGICFNVFCYNAQPYIEIDYATGDSRKADSSVNEPENSITYEEKDDFENTKKVFILNMNSHKIHMPDCESVEDINERNKTQYEGTLKELKEQGYTACKNCLPDH